MQIPCPTPLLVKMADHIENKQNLNDFENRNRRLHSALSQHDRFIRHGIPVLLVIE